MSLIEPDIHFPLQNISELTSGPKQGGKFSQGNYGLTSDNGFSLSFGVVTRTDKTGLDNDYKTRQYYNSNKPLEIIHSHVFDDSHYYVNNVNCLRVDNFDYDDTAIPAHPYEQSSHSRNKVLKIDVNGTSLLRHEIKYVISSWMYLNTENVDTDGNAIFDWFFVIFTYDNHTNFNEGVKDGSDDPSYRSFITKLINGEKVGADGLFYSDLLQYDSVIMNITAYKKVNGKYQKDIAMTSKFCKKQGDNVYFSFVDTLFDRDSTTREINSSTSKDSFVIQLFKPDVSDVTSDGIEFLKSIFDLKIYLLANKNVGDGDNEFFSDSTGTSIFPSADETTVHDKILKLVRAHVKEPTFGFRDLTSDTENKLGIGGSKFNDKLMVFKTDGATKGAIPTTFDHADIEVEKLFMRDEKTDEMRELKANDDAFKYENRKVMLEDKSSSNTAVFLM